MNRTARNELETWEIYAVEDKEVIMKFRTKGAADNMLPKLKKHHIQELLVRRIEK